MTWNFWFKPGPDSSCQTTTQKGQPWSQPNEKLSPSLQSSFSIKDPRKSCPHAAHKSSHFQPSHTQISLCLPRWLQVSILTLLDLSAGFDTFDHSILLCCLEQHFGVSGLAVSWFKSYLSNRFQFVSASGSKLQAIHAWLWGATRVDARPNYVCALHTSSTDPIQPLLSCPHQFFCWWHSTAQIM